MAPMGMGMYEMYGSYVTFENTASPLQGCQVVQGRPVWAIADSGLCRPM